VSGFDCGLSLVTLHGSFDELVELQCSYIFWLIKVGDGREFAFDLTAAQFGYHRTVTPYNEYKGPSLAMPHGSFDVLVDKAAVLSYCRMRTSAVSVA